jgi:hypothetical protein
MASANDDVTAALDSVLSGEAETQSAEASGSEAKIDDAVKAAVAEALKDQSPSDDKKSASEEKGSKDEPKTVPYERFSEVIGQKNEAVERMNSLDEQFKSASERENTLKTRVGELEQDHQILEAIRGLASDDRYSDAVNKIDRALQGIEDEVEVAEEKGDEKAVAVAEKKFEAKAAELEDLIADQRADQLFDKANDFASAMLDSLPDEYTDDDKRRLGQLWTPRVDWDSIETQGEGSIPDKLRSSFSELIKDYGSPQGAVVKKTRTEVESEIPKEALDAKLSPEDAVKSALDKDWGAIDEDKFVHSDDEFANDLAKVLRATNRG